MTPTDVATLVATAPMPPGYSLQIQPQRKHKHRNLWDIRVMRDGERVWGRAYYNPAVGIVVAQANAWAMSRETA
jgi:hypothetical protein